MGAGSMGGMREESGVAGPVPAMLVPEGACSLGFGAAMEPAGVGAMRGIGLGLVVVGCLLASAQGARAANVCRAANLSCATTMPVGGYCECTAKGQTQDGTVEAGAPRKRANATAGGCGANPGAPGCR